MVNDCPPCWHNLVSFELVEGRFTKREIIEFLRRHAKSLRHLGLENCEYYADISLYQTKTTGNWGALMRAMAGLELLRLHSIAIHTETLDEVNLVDPVHGKILVEFLNNTGSSPFQENLAY